VIVLDASAVVELVLHTVGGAKVAGRIASEDETLHAPHLLDVEVVQALRRYVRAGEVEPNRGRSAIDFLTALDVTRYSHQPFLPRIWELRENITAYDATYITLAEALDCPLVTMDRKLGIAPGVNVAVEVLA
jgi:predicted nucleic acid-binding protein